MKQSRKKKPAKISDAVFRGIKADYTFEVYPLAAEIPETPAVYIFSRRKIHNSGRASHATSCIGETDSAPAELKKHKRAKCVKQNASNVMCVLRVESDKSRTAILNDITNARTFCCVRNVFEPTMLRKPNVQIRSSKQVFSSFVPSVSLPLKPVRRRRMVEASEPVQSTEQLKNAGRAAPGGKRSRIMRQAASAKTEKAGDKKTRIASTKAKPATANPPTQGRNSVDRNRGKHRLSKQERPVGGRAKTRTSQRAGTRKKAAA